MKFFMLACSICFGNPASALAKGASAGALFLLGVVGFVLGGIATVIVVWSRRARKIDSSGGNS